MVMLACIHWLINTCATRYRDLYKLTSVHGCLCVCMPLQALLLLCDAFLCQCNLCKQCLCHTVSLLQVAVSHTASIQCQLLYQCHTGLAIETLVNHLGDNVADEVFVNTGDGMPAIPASANSVPPS